MKAALNAVYWEILWKNRVVFPVLAVLLGLGAALTWTANNADPATNWISQARTVTVVTFLVSVLIGFACFTLMENSGGWRMNSMITRWFALPMRTPQMVFLPLLASCVLIALLVGLWVPVLNRIAPGLDAPYFIAVLAVGQVALNALAWTVPRKPLQYWVGAGILFPFILVLAFGQQDHPGQEQVRRGLLVPLSYATVLLCAYTWFAASRNRCGAWPGEVPLDRFWQLLRGGSGTPRRHDFRSAMTAMFRSEALPNVRLLALSWITLILIIFTWISLAMREARPQYAFNPRLLASMALGILPVLGVLWMAAWGLLAAGEPSGIFRAKLSSFRSTLPVSCGVLAGQRIAMLFLGWIIVWLPLILMSYFYNAEITGMPEERTLMVQTALARFMAVGAFALVGALPFFLWGRFEGFPNFLLAALCTWGWIWAIASNLSVTPDEAPGWRWGLLAALLALKFGSSAWAFAAALRHGHITWKFPLILVSGWLAVVTVLIWVLPIWKSGGSYVAMGTVLLVPLARLAWAPLAMAANRHR